MSDRTMPDAHPLRSGDPTRLGAYEILGRLGEGGQGAVFLGRRAPEDPETAAPAKPSEYVAIKLLHAGLAGDDAARARFVRELEVAKRVARFCTAQVVDAEVEGDQPYIVGEYVPGQSLHRLVLAEGPRTAGALERLAISTLTALIAIHQAGIVHRDFKPHNVMMGPDGPRVIDFGVARALNAVGETQNVGTPAYMAPEHFTGGEVGPGADMFAWGTTMVFAANGRPAFGNDDMAQVMHRILTGEPDLGELASPLRDVVLACLDKEPARRPTAREAQERLVNAATGTPPADAPGPAPGPPPPFPGPFPSTPAPAQDMPVAGPPAPSGLTDPYGLNQGRLHDPGAVRGSTAPQPPQPPEPPLLPPVPVPAPAGGKRRGPLVPIAAAAAVIAVIATGSVWAATRSGDGGKDEQRTAAADQSGAPSEAGAGQGLPGGAPKSPKNSASTPQGKKPGQKPNDPKNPKGRPQQTAPGPGGQNPPTSGGGGPVQEPPNKYTPQQACGSGYHVLRSQAGSGGTAYLLYSNSTQKNCAVTMKTRGVGKATPVSTWVQRKGGSQVKDGGSFAWYAGPVYVSAPKQCVRFGGNGATAPWGNCG